MILTTSHDLSVLECPSCAGVFAILKSYKEEAHRLGGFKKCWTCPYCKVERGYGKGEADRFAEEKVALQKTLEATRKDVAWHSERRQQAAAEAEHFRKSRDGMKGQLVRVKNRIRNGVCPCCNRTFANLASHMKTQHPETVS